MDYELETPLHLPAGSKLVLTGHYDDSKMNMHNPGPDKPVYFRDMNQSWDEMFTPFIQYSVDDQHSSPDASTGSSRQREQTVTKVLQIAEVVGCLESSPSGDWMLTKASEPTRSAMEATSSAALKVAESRPLGDDRYKC